MGVLTRGKVPLLLFIFLSNHMVFTVQLMIIIKKLNIINKHLFESLSLSTIFENRLPTMYFYGPYCLSRVDTRGVSALMRV